MSENGPKKSAENEGLVFGGRRVKLPSFAGARRIVGQLSDKFAMPPENINEMPLNKSIEILNLRIQYSNYPGRKSPLRLSFDNGEVLDLVAKKEHLDFLEEQYGKYLNEKNRARKTESGTNEKVSMFKGIFCNPLNDIFGEQESELNQKGIIFRDGKFQIVQREEVIKYELSSH